MLKKIPLNATTIFHHYSIQILCNNLISLNENIIR